MFAVKFLTNLCACVFLVLYVCEFVCVDVVGVLCFYRFAFAFGCVCLLLCCF